MNRKVVLNGASLPVAAATEVEVDDLTSRTTGTETSCGSLTWGPASGVQH